MSVEFDWAGAISLHQAATLADTIAETWVREVPTGGSRPQIWECSDGSTYYVKHPNNPQDHGNGIQGSRILVAERVFGLLAARLDAPCGAVRLLDIPQFLVDAGQLAYQDGSGRALGAGVAHGSREIEDVQPGPPPSETIPENRPRYSSLAILHAWFVPSDVQWLHEITVPHRIWSVDHGGYLPGHNLWTPQLLEQNRDPVLGTPFAGAALTTADLEAAFAPLTDLSERDVAQVVGSIPLEWDVALDDLVALGRWLWSRFARLRAEWG
jgi:hypothetical protein